ncbi:hypothetical protein BBO99_00008227 [Phytophthora kernoviae]|uniref:DNA replication factor Cdt1 C-terminal domain-containing protein n=2 Tax=Phytophthora kernoviae TaxID=325452 RepID=A0A3R7HSL6_9STRA|nr:hypothetical protein G195_009384 [Phytophthora kernoviae 00238/432]KAG2516814.1 hypothetical protein JM18_007900 [Phytophthora kernoviae]KAG2524084.1 hypothetical protein JM16_003802 [Phytophthora kernoviae]RLN21171.1 hypothetical protein BBI17_008202 [Phytophthora kernoviae]RLN75576.1 hypothetical protein BBO99_00008227 [Phytophthora kernoviae]
MPATDIDSPAHRPVRRLHTLAPPSLRILVRLFSALEFGLGALTLYQHTPDFAAVKRSVETVIKQEFPSMTEEELGKALKLLEVETASLPKVPTEMSNEESTAVLLGKKISGSDAKNEEDGKEKLEEVLAKPVPSDLQTLPEWLINKVRKQELGRKEVAESSAKTQKRRLMSTLPQLSDQLQSLVMVTRKSIFLKAELVKRLAARAPIKGKIEEQVYMLESMVPEWLTVVIDDGNEYVKISKEVKYNTVKTSLRRAIAISA